MKISKCVYVSYLDRACFRFVMSNVTLSVFVVSYEYENNENTLM